MSFLAVLAVALATATVASAFVVFTYAQGQPSAVCCKDGSGPSGIWAVTPGKTTRQYNRVWHNVSGEWWLRYERQNGSHTPITFGNPNPLVDGTGGQTLQGECANYDDHTTTQFTCQTTRP